jgi:hypothetical protein
MMSAFASHRRNAAQRDHALEEPAMFSSCIVAFVLEEIRETTFFLFPARGEGFYWGAGPVLYYPTATNTALGVNKWGPARRWRSSTRTTAPLGCLALSSTTSDHSEASPIAAIEPTACW